MRRALLGVLPDEHLFSPEEPRRGRVIAEEVVARRYRTVFTGGGDGTFVAWVNRILETRRAPRRASPRFGVLALGTGNAVAEMVGARARAGTSRTWPATSAARSTASAGSISSPATGAARPSPASASMQRS